jgi:hypothetical protein
MENQASMNGVHPIIAPRFSLDVLLSAHESLNIRFAAREGNESQSDMSQLGSCTGFPMKLAPILVRMNIEWHSTIFHPPSPKSMDYLIVCISEISRLCCNLGRSHRNNPIEQVAMEYLLLDDGKASLRLKEIDRRVSSFPFLIFHITSRTSIGREWLALDQMTYFQRPFSFDFVFRSDSPCLRG